jgi:hypothetical protein
MTRTVIIAPDHMAVGATRRIVSCYSAAETEVPLDNQLSHGPSWKLDQKKAP